MRVLVTGGAGFLGRHFCAALRDRGDSVTAVDDLSNPWSDWPSEVSHHQMDLGDFLALTDHGHYDEVYHFAAPVGGREKIEGDPLFNADSLRLDSLFFRWAVRMKPGVVIYPSSSAVYGVSYQTEVEEGVVQLPLHESFFHPAENFWGAPDEIYGLTKMVGEVLAWKAGVKYGLNTLCIRPFSGYGEDQPPDYPMPAICARALRKEDPLVVWGSGQQKRDFIHVDDVVGATMARLTHLVDGYETMNIGSGVATSFDQIARMAAEIMGYEPRIEHREDKPEGVSVRHSDPVRMRMVYTPKVSLMDGIARMLGYPL